MKKEIEKKGREELESIGYIYDGSIKIDEEVFMRFKRWDEFIMYKVY